MNLSKFKFLLIVFISFISISTFAQRGTRVGYIDMNIILKNIDEYNKASSLLIKILKSGKRRLN